MRALLSKRHILPHRVHIASFLHANGHKKTSLTMMTRTQVIRVKTSILLRLASAQGSSTRPLLIANLMTKVATESNSPRVQRRAQSETPNNRKINTSLTAGGAIRLKNINKNNLLSAAGREIPPISTWAVMKTMMRPRPEALSHRKDHQV